MNASGFTCTLQSDVGLCIMMHSMVEKVFFYLEEQWYKECLPEAAEAVRTFKGYGFESDLWVVEGGDELPAPEYDALYIADSERLLMQLQDLGAAFCGYSHGGNRAQDLKRADYILMEPQWVDRDSLVKIWQRQRHLPWTILETARCEVREFVPEDLEAIRALYDEDALKFLEVSLPALRIRPLGSALQADRGTCGQDRLFLPEQFCTGTGAGRDLRLSCQKGLAGERDRPGGLRGSYRVRLYAARIRADRGRYGAVQYRFRQNIAIFWFQRGSAQGRSALLYTEQK